MLQAQKLKGGQGKAMCCVVEVKQGLGCTREGKLCLETAKAKITLLAQPPWLYGILSTLRATGY